MTRRRSKTGLRERPRLLVGESEEVDAQSRVWASGM